MIAAAQNPVYNNYKLLVIKGSFVIIHELSLEPDDDL
jgi:hypothetical protein